MGEFDALDEFTRAMCVHYGLRPPPAPKRPALVAVAPENAHKFVPSTKRRGRKCKVPMGGNVVAIGVRHG